jgi:hypothetical protein
MAETQPMPLIERGVRQGCLIACVSLGAEGLSKIKNGRAAEALRDKEISTDNMLLVLSQDCDINNKSDPILKLSP